MEISKKLKDILNILEKNNLIKDKNIIDENIDIKCITYDSKKVIKDSLFVCKGQKFKLEYLLQAINSGANVYISEVKYSSIDNISYIIVNDINKAMAIMSGFFYEYAYNDFKLIGITGTKGKTTTTNFLNNILNDYTNSKNSYISTMYIYTKTTDQISHLTTPEALDLHRYFYETKLNNIKYLTMEVSSQSYKVGRVYGVNFDIGVFLNISEDHISPLEHPSFEDYLNCKIQLLNNSKVCILNKNMDYYDTVISAINEKEKKEIITYGYDDTADFYMENIQKEGEFLSFIVKSKKYNYEKKYITKMQGRFNIENALAAITIAKVLKVPDNSIYNGIKQTQVAGRMTILKFNNRTVIIDYAHNYLSFLKIYESIKTDFFGQDIITVFGCPGNKAYGRRKDLGTLSGENSKYVYLTADDPQYEDVKSICNDIASYIQRYHNNYEIVIDRKEAITKALSNSKENDVILIAGKGAETSQKINGKIESYISDIEVVKEYIANLN